jgi:glycosyltransferase involved in cell wall biosynthesis
MEASPGSIDATVRATLESQRAAARASMMAAVGAAPDVLFAHEAAVAEEALDRRRSWQQVWLMLHSPMPLALYLAWNWGMPEHDWRELRDLPDVRRWNRWEAEICARVDRVIIPCPEAWEELCRADEVFAQLGAPDFLLTGATRGEPGAGRTVARRTRQRARGREPLGLFLGNLQPYRGFDALLAALPLLPPAVRGIIGVAGPASESVPHHARVRALGAVEDVSGLLAAADFVINVNRFSLFDLSLIEAAEAGKPMLLHDVGGNQRFRILGAGCRMLADLTPQTIAAGLTEMMTLSAATRNDLSVASRACYERHLTPRHLWRRHASCYDEAAIGSGTCMDSAWNASRL